jgi:hypothetical protein
MFESPKFLLARGRQAEAVAVVHGIAYYNNSTTWLTEDILNQIGGDPDVTNEKLATADIVKRNLGKFSTQRIKPLFDGWRLGTTTALLWFSKSHPLCLVRSRSLTTSSMGHYRDGLPTLQCLPTSVPRELRRCRWPNAAERHLPQLCNYKHSRVRKS